MALFGLIPENGWVDGSLQPYGTPPPPGAMTTVPQASSGVLGGILDWARAPAGMQAPTAAQPTKLGLLAAALKDAGSGGRTQYVQELRQRAQQADAQQKRDAANKAIRDAYSTGDMNKVRQALVNLSASDPDAVSHIMQALQFGRPESVARAPGTTVFSRDPFTGQETEQYKVPEKATPNQPFNPDGTPNIAYQKYQERLRQLGRDQGLGPDALFSTIDTGSGMYGVTRSGKISPFTDPATGKPLTSYHSDVGLRFDMGAANKGGQAAGANAEAWPATDGNFQTLADTLKQFQDPKIKSQAGKSIGFGAILPTVPGQNSDFRALQGKLKGGAFLLAYQNLRGGGAITDIEGQKAEQAYLDMTNAQTPEEFYRALDDFNKILGRAHYAARTRAERGMSVPQLGTPRAATPGAPKAPTVSNW